MLNFNLIDLNSFNNDLEYFHSITKPDIMYQLIPNSFSKSKLKIRFLVPEGYHSNGTIASHFHGTVTIISANDHLKIDASANGNHYEQENLSNSNITTATNLAKAVIKCINKMIDIYSQKPNKSLE